MMSDPNAPPPPPAYAGGYPAQPYPGWQQPAPPQYRPMLPAWLSFGSILVLVGGVLLLVGFVLEAIANSAYASADTASAFTNYFNTLAWGNALIGVGIFLAFLGWLFHQMSRHRQTAMH
jgi:uncharacterized membrane protein